MWRDFCNTVHPLTKDLFDEGIQVVWGIAAPSVCKYSVLFGGVPWSCGCWFYYISIFQSEKMSLRFKHTF